MKKYIILLIVPLFAISCGNKNVVDADGIERFVIEDFGEAITLTGEELEFDQIVYNPFRMIIKDSLLFVYNVRTEYAFQVFNLNSMKQIGEYVLYGNGPNEMLGPKFVQSNDTTLWLYDQPKREVYKYSTKNFLNYSSPIPYEKFKLEDASEDLSIINNKIFSFKLHEILENRFNIFDLQGKLLESKGSFPPYKKDLTYEEIKFGFTGEYATNYNDRIFLTHKLIDLIEIYDINENLQKRMQGPDNIALYVEDRSSKDVQYAKPKDEAKEAYFSPANAGDEVFVMYSGELYSKNIMHEQTILVFDWNGKPLRHYELDKGIYEMKVDAKNRMIYGFSDEPECHIIRFKY